MSTNKINPDDFIVKRIGLKYNPSQIILEYLVPSNGKLFHHKIRLDYLNSESQTSELVKRVKEKHASIFVKNRVTEDQIEKLINKIKEQFKKGGKGIIERHHRKAEKNEEKKETKAYINNFISDNRNSKNEFINTASASPSQSRQYDNKANQKQTFIEAVPSTEQRTPFQKQSIVPVKASAPKVIPASEAAASRQNQSLSNPPIISNKKSSVKELEKEEDVPFQPFDFSSSDEDSGNEKTIKLPDNKQKVQPINAHTQKIQQSGAQPKSLSSQNSSDKYKEPTNKRQKSFGFEDISENDSQDEDNNQKNSPNAKQTTEEYQEEEFEIYEEDFEKSNESQDNKKGIAQKYQNSKDILNNKSQPINLKNNSGNKSQLSKFDYNKVDLNKLSNEELNKHKAQMEIDFIRNQKKIGDSGFIYDKRENFKGNELNEWDEDL